MYAKQNHAGSYIIDWKESGPLDAPLEIPRIFFLRRDLDRMDPIAVFGKEFFPIKEIFREGYRREWHFSSSRSFYRSSSSVHQRLIRGDIVAVSVGLAEEMAGRRNVNTAWLEKKGTI